MLSRSKVKRNVRAVKKWTAKRISGLIVMRSSKKDKVLKTNRNGSRYSNSGEYREAEKVIEAIIARPPSLGIGEAWSDRWFGISRNWLNLLEFRINQVNKVATESVVKNAKRNSLE